MRIGRAFAAVVMLMGFDSAATAVVHTEKVEYRQGNTLLRGIFAWDDMAPGKRPGVLVVHEWWGLNKHARDQARRLAESGYVGFALDMFGKGKVTTHPEDAQAFVTEATQDPEVVKARFNAALEVLRKSPHVDPTKLAAIGYCFGGGVVLGMARSGVDLAAVVSFHGVLATRTPAEKGMVKARLLVLDGGADPMVPPEQVQAFKDEMTAAGARFDVIIYPGARHSFTNPRADKAGMEGLAYDAVADRKSWEAMLEMFRQVFG